MVVHRGGPPVRAMFPKPLAMHILDAAYPPPHPFLHDPTGWIQTELHEHPWSKQAEICRSVVEHPYTAVQSCHDAGKSYIASRILLWWLNVHPPGQAFVVTTAPTAAQVEAVLWREVDQGRAKGDLPGRTTMDARYYLPIAGKDQLVAFGRKPADHNPAAFSGIHARYVLVIMDEACGIPKQLYDAVDSLATNRHARVLAIGNPDDPQSEFAKVCSPGDKRWENVIRISAFDTPNFSEDRVAVRNPDGTLKYPALVRYMETHGIQPTTESVPTSIRDLLLDPGWVEQRLKRWGPNSPVFIPKVLGLFPELSDRAVFTRRLLRQCYELDLPGMEAGVRAFDIAEEGRDKTVAYWNRGGVVRWLWDGPRQDLPQTTRDIAGVLAPYPEIPAWIDATGLGSGPFGELRRAGYNVLPFKGGEAAHESGDYANRRAESYFAMKRMAELNELDLAADDEHAEDLEHDLLSIRWKKDSKGRLLLESKEDMAKRGIRSTDYGDPASMSCQSPAGHVQAAADLKAAKGTKRKPSGIAGDLLTRPM